MRSKLKELNEAILRCTDATERKKLEQKRAFLFAKHTNKIDMYRQSEIAHRVQEEYSLDKQVAIILDGDADEIATLKAFRAQMATEVDEMIAQYESEVET